MTRVLRFALLVAFVLPASPAAAATFAVTTTADSGDVNPGDGICVSGAGGKCTLRAALGEANTLAGSDTVVLPAGSYTLDNALGQLGANSTVTIEGAGARSTVITAGAGSRAFTVTANLTLRGVTVTGGNPSSTGAIRGGGILISSGDVTLERVAVRNNTVSSQTHANGGGVAATGGSLTILDSTISANTASGIAGFPSNGGGGGIYAAAPTEIRRSTISGNVTRNVSAGQYSSGGGILVADNVVADHVTIVGNTATTLGDSSGFRLGGNINVAGSSSLALSSSIVAGGTASNGPNCYAYGTVTEPARNLSDGFDCMGAGSLRGQNPKLGALADNGGETDTRAPAADSPAVNAATACGPRPADQRGNPLPAGPACDLGAVELGADRSVTVQASKTAAAAGEDVTVIATISNANAGADHAIGETLTLDLPAGATATTASSTLGTCTTGATVTCTLGTLARGAGATIIATVRADGSALGITARRGGPVPDQNAANDTATVTVAGLGAPAAAPAPPTQPGVTTVQPGPSGEAAGQQGDRTAPVVRGLRLGGRPTLRRGATLRFQVSEAATVSILVQRLVRGHRSGARCAAKGRGKACTRVLKVATRTARVSRAGTVSVKVPRKALKTGRLRFTVVARDAAGNASKAVRVSGKVRAR